MTVFSIAIDEMSGVAARDMAARGFVQDDTPVGRAVKIALIHSEVTEILEAVRKPSSDKHLPHLSSEAVELADVAIRVLEYAGAFGIDLGAAIEEKMAFNRKRPFKHGGKAF